MKQKAMFALLLAATTLQVSAQTGETPVEEKKLTLVSDLKLCGYLISQYQWVDQKDAESNGFNIRMARISLEGRALTDFYWKAQIQFNGNTATLGASPRVVDVFAEWQKFKPFRVKLGQFKRPFTFENPLHPIDQGFMSFGQSVLKLSGFSDRTGEAPSNGRDIGLQIQGDLFPNCNDRPLVHYQVGVFNGQGINMRDADQRKDVIGGLWVMPVKGMRIGAFGWTGSYARKGSYTLVDPDTHQPILDIDGKEQVVKGKQTVEKRRFALSGEYVTKGWTFRSEYIYSKGYGFKTTYNTKADEQDANINYAAGDKAYGFYGLVIAPVADFNGKKLHVMARFDQYCPNGKSNTAKTYYELGVDCELSRRLKLSAEYARVNDKALKKPNYNLIDFQVGLKF